MTSTKQHWDQIFASTNDEALGWFESDASQTLKFIDVIPQAHLSRIFIPGAGTSVLVDELLARGHSLLLNDISLQALENLKSRIGVNEKKIIWLRHDIATPLPAQLPQVDLWVDRAVLHFLLEERAIQGYFENLNALVKPEGYTLLAEFSTEGASKCAGLQLHRYSIEEMSERLGKKFCLVKHENYTFSNPQGEPRPYLYALFQKKRAIST